MEPLREPLKGPGMEPLKEPPKAGVLSVSEQAIWKWAQRLDHEVDQLLDESCMRVCLFILRTHTHTLSLSLSLCLFVYIYIYLYNYIHVCLSGLGFWGRPVPGVQARGHESCGSLARWFQVALRV